MKKVSNRKALTNSLRALMLAVSVMAAGGAAVAAESKLQLIQERGKLLAGVRGDYPPMGYMNKEGKLVGFGVDLAAEFARRMGVEVEYVVTRTQTRTPLLHSGAIDVEFGPTTPSKPREEVVDFSNPYVWDQMVIVVRKGDETDPNKYYNNTGVVIGGLQNSSFVENWMLRSPKSQVKGYQEYPDLLTALMTKKVDVALMSEVTAQELKEVLGKRSDAITVGGAFFADPQAIMLPQDDSKWRNFINWGLQRLWADGTYQELYKKHFKIEPKILPWHNGILQPRVTEISSKNDPWKAK